MSDFFINVIAGVMIGSISTMISVYLFYRNRLKKCDNCKVCEIYLIAEKIKQKVIDGEIKIYHKYKDTE